MRNIRKDIEQLQIAGDLIDRRTPTTARLALFLIDNVMELAMWRVVRLVFAYDSVPWRAEAPKYSASKRGKIKADFKKRVGFLCEELGKIAASDAKVLRVGHDLRNESYHNGQVRDIVVGPLVQTYFQVACRLYPSLWLGDFAFSHHSEITSFLKEFGLDGSMIDQDVLRTICSRLAQGRACPTVDLANAIADHLTQRIEETMQCLNDLASARPGGAPGDALKWVQFHEAGIPAFERQRKTFAEWCQRVESEFAAFRPKVTLSTLQRWSAEAEQLRSARYAGPLVDTFWQIDVQFLPIENAVTEAILAYEHEHDM